MDSNHHSVDNTITHPQEGGYVRIDILNDTPLRYIIRIITTNTLIVSPINNMDSVSSITYSDHDAEWKVDGFEFNRDFKYSISFEPIDDIKITDGSFIFRDLYTDLKVPIENNNYVEADNIIRKYQRSVVSILTFNPEMSFHDVYLHPVKNKPISEIIIYLEWMYKHGAIIGGYLIITYLDTPHIYDIIEWIQERNISFTDDPNNDNNESLHQYINDVVYEYVLCTDNVRLFTTLLGIDGFFSFLSKFTETAQVMEWITIKINKVNAINILESYTPRVKSVRKG